MNTRTSAECSSAAKAAYACRQADKASGIPSIAALTRTLGRTGCYFTVAAARREAVKQIEQARAKVTSAAYRAEQHAKLVAALEQHIATRRAAGPPVTAAEYDAPDAMVEAEFARVARAARGLPAPAPTFEAPVVRGVIRGGGSGAGAWVARIVGRHERFGFDRQFLDKTGHVSRSGRSGSFKWTLDRPGLYELRAVQYGREEATIGALDSGFVLVDAAGNTKRLSRARALVLVADLPSKAEPPVVEQVAKDMYELAEAARAARAANPPTAPAGDRRPKGRRPTPEATA